MTTLIKDKLLKRGELKYLGDTFENVNNSSIRDVTAERGTVEQKSILCGDSEFSIRDIIADCYLRGDVLPSGMIDLSKELLKERGLL